MNPHDNLRPGRHCDLLFSAGATAQTLEAAGITILGYYSNGRRPVLIIDQPPPLLQGAPKRRQPNGDGGIDLVMAAPYENVQLEWTVKSAMPRLIADVLGATDAVREVGHV